MNRVLRRLRSDGPAHLIETTFNRLIPPWVARYSVGVVLELDLAALSDRDRGGPKDATEPEPKPERFESIATRDRRRQLRRATWNSVDPATTTNDIGYAVVPIESPHEMLGGVWVGVDDFLESNLGFQIQLRSDQAWLYCASIDKTVRGGGLYTRLLAHVARDVLDRGYRELLVMIQPWNRASMHIHEKYACGRRGQVTVTRVGPICHVKTTGLTAARRWTRPADPIPIHVNRPADGR